jgi:hypothetical protein
MSALSRSHPQLSRLTRLAVMGVLLAAGCSHVESTQERVDNEYKRTGMQRPTLFPLAGRVTVDGEAPTLKSNRWAIVVMAFDASKADAGTRGQFYAASSRDGSFTFGDGLPAGKYVMLFAGLEYNRKKGWHGPDTLKNLYNDPDVNGKKTEFIIDHQQPGKKDYSFDLALTGQTAVASPGPKALLHLAD